jgi:tRNA(Ile)-lysidine synthase
LFEAVVVSGGADRLFDPQRSFDPALLRKTLLIRNWRPGDRFWPAHTKAPKKIKELLQEQHVTGPERKRWPVVLNETDVIWVRGFPSPKHLRPSPASKEALVIQETTLKT